MRKLLYLLLVSSVVACTKQSGDVLAIEPVTKKIEWHIHASDTYNGPWMDTMTARVQVRLHKSDTVQHTFVAIWDTTFENRTLQQYPVLPQKLIIEKKISLLPTEKLQAWYNIRYEMKGTASETGRLDVVEKPFTFIDIKL